MRLVKIRLHHSGCPPGVRSLLRGTVSVAADPPHSYYADTRWDGNDEDVANAGQWLELLRKGDLDPQRAARLSSLLGKMLPDGVEFGASDERGGIGVQPESLGGDTRFVTDVPWELLPRSDTVGHHEVVKRTVASLPFVRLVESSSGEPKPTGRPRLLCAVAEDANGALPPVRATEFKEAFTSAITAVSAFDARWLQVAPAQVTKERLRQNIYESAPHVFLLVAHGSAADGKPAEIHLANGPVQVASLAGWLTESGQCAVAVLLCCDLVAGSTDSASAGAARLITDGVPEVVAMQGVIDQRTATEFVEALLVALLRNAPLPRAVRDARLAIASHDHAILPVTFRRATTTESPLSAVTREFARARTEAIADLTMGDRPPVARTVESEIERALGKVGLLVVHGPAHSGKTVVLRTVGRNVLQTGLDRRPVLWLDAFGETGASVASLASAFDRVCADRSALLPSQRDRSPVDTPEDLALAIDRLAVTIIIDTDEATTRQDWYQRLLRCAALMETSLLVISCRQQPEVPEASSVPMGWYTAEEVEAYLQQRIPGLTSEAQPVHELTHGHPVLLDALAVRLRNRPEPELEDVEEFDSTRAVEALAEEIVAAAEQQSEAEDASISPLDALALLSRIDTPASSKALAEFYLPADGYTDDAYSCLEFLHSIGATGRRQIGNDFVVSITPLVREALAGKLEPRAEGASARLHKQLLFLAEDGKNMEALAELNEQRGGGALLSAMQEAVLSTEPNVEIRWARAAAIPTYLDSGGTARSLIDMYRRVGHADAPDDVRSRALVRLGRLTHASGDIDTAEWCLTELSGFELGARDRAEALLLSAAVRKSRDQHAGTPGVLRELWQARRVLERDGEQRYPELEWAISQLEIDTRCFLLNESVDEFRWLLDALTHHADAAVRGQALSTLAEMLRRDAALDEEWAAAADNARKGYQLTQHDEDRSRRAYCAYQYAKCAELRPKSDPQLALELYEESASLGRECGDWGRRALAKRSAWRMRFILRAGSDPREAIAELDALVDSNPGAPSSHDVLTLRALDRVFRLMADLASEHHLGGASSYAMSACRAIMRLPTVPQSDRERFRGAAANALELLESMGDARGAELFVQEIRGFASDHLSVCLSPDEPRDAINKLNEWSP